MYVPRILDRVRVKDQPGIFLLVRVDQTRELVDVMKVEKPDARIKDIPFSAIEPFEE